MHYTMTIMHACGSLRIFLFVHVKAMGDGRWIQVDSSLPTYYILHSALPPYIIVSSSLRPDLVQCDDNKKKAVIVDIKSALSSAMFDNVDPANCEKLNIPSTTVV